MTPRLSGLFSILGLVFIVLSSLLGIARQWSRGKFANFDSKASRVMLEFSYIESGLLVGCWCPQVKNTRNELEICPQSRLFP